MADGPLAIGIDIGGTKVAGGVVDADGTVLHRARRDTPHRSKSPRRRRGHHRRRSSRSCSRAAATTWPRSASAPPASSPPTAPPSSSPRTCPGATSRCATALQQPAVRCRSSSTTTPTPRRGPSGASAPRRGETHVVMVTLGTGIGGGIVIERPGHARPLRHRRRVRPHAGRARRAAAASAATAAAGSSTPPATRSSARPASLIDRQHPRSRSDLLDRVGGDPGNLTGPLITEAARDGDPTARRAARRDRPAGSASASPTWPRPSTPASFVIGGGVSAAGDLLLGPAREAFRGSSPAAATGPRRASWPPELGNEAGLDRRRRPRARDASADTRRAGARAERRAAPCGSRPTTCATSRTTTAAAARVVRGDRPRRAVPAGGAAPAVRPASGSAAFAARVRPVLARPAPGQRRHDDLHVAAGAGGGVQPPPAAGALAPAHPGVCRDPRGARRVASRSWRRACTSASTRTSGSGTPGRSCGRSPTVARSFSRATSTRGTRDGPGGSSPCPTGCGWSRPTAPTFPARRPRRRLDVVFASPELAVLPHREVDLAEADLAAASDHRPVWVDLDLGA